MPFPRYLRSVFRHQPGVFLRGYQVFVGVSKNNCLSSVPSLNSCFFIQNSSVILSFTYLH